MTSHLPLLLLGGTVIDGLSGRPRANTAILIRGGRITAVGDPLAVGVPDGAEVLDLAGRWVIPGLIEMHCHIKDHMAAQYVAGGVTTVRNCAGWLAELADLRNAPPDAPTPRVISAGRIIDGPPGLFPGGTSVGAFLTEDPVEARAEVRRQAAAGVEFIKVYGLLTRAVMQAAVEEAAALGLFVSCDLTYQKHVTIRDAAQMGIRWNEHATGFAQALYPGWKLSWNDTDWGPTPWCDGDSPELDRLCAEVAESGLILCPTQMLFEQAGQLPGYWLPDHPVAQFVKADPEIAAGYSAFPEFAQPGARRMAVHAQAVARAYRRAGGTVVAGTDAPAFSWNIPGLSLHRELQLLVQNGWSPLEALRAATVTAARALGRTDLGVITPGAVADLVVLNGDPLAAIENTLLTDRIVKGGAVYTPQTALAHLMPQPDSKAKYERLMAEYQAAEAEA